MIQTILCTNELIVNLEIHPDSNIKSFVVDIILIYDEKIEHILEQITSSDYFEKKNFLIRENPMAMNVYSIDAIPGKTLTNLKYKVNSKYKLLACIIFANLNKNDSIPKKVIFKNINIVNVKIKKNGVYAISD